jgi:periplasmic protein TonB
VSAAARIGPGDRLAATLALSLIAHGVLLLGVGFTREPPAPLTPTLDVILTQTRSPETPDKADFLAQASQEGGGEQEKPERPQDPQSSPVPKTQEGIAPREIQASAPRPREARPETVVTSVHRDAPQLAEQGRDPVPDTPLPDSRELIERSLEMARLSAELERQRQDYAKRPRRKFLSAATREYEYAAYMRGWVARVERIGNLNFPDEARRRQLEGQLVLTVAVRRDGSVESVELINSSGYPVLDEAAIRIVRLAEPFAPIPQTGEQVDVLHITRTWQFLPGGVLRNR